MSKYNDNREEKICKHFTANVNTDSSSSRHCVLVKTIEITHGKNVNIN